MSRTYYTSLCMAWLDHEVLIRPDEQEKLFELIVNQNGNTECICEWLIDRLQGANDSKTKSDLLDNLEEIEFAKIAEILQKR